jgi:hypothetical protein
MAVPEQERTAVDALTSTSLVQLLIAALRCFVSLL